MVPMVGAGWCFIMRYLLKMRRHFWNFKQMQELKLLSNFFLICLSGGGSAFHFQMMLIVLMTLHLGCKYSSLHSR